MAKRIKKSVPLFEGFDDAIQSIYLTDMSPNQYRELITGFVEYMRSKGAQPADGDWESVAQLVSYFGFKISRDQPIIMPVIVDEFDEVAELIDSKESVVQGWWTSYLKDNYYKIHKAIWNL